MEYEGFTTDDDYAIEMANYDREADEAIARCHGFVCACIAPGILDLFCPLCGDRVRIGATDCTKAAWTAFREHGWAEVDGRIVCSSHRKF